MPSTVSSWVLGTSGEVFVSGKVSIAASKDKGVMVVSIQLPSRDCHVSTPAWSLSRSSGLIPVRTDQRSPSIASSLHLRSDTDLSLVRTNRVSIDRLLSHSWSSATGPATDVRRGCLVYLQTNSISRQKLHEGRAPSHFVLRERHDSHASAVRRLLDRLSPLLGCTSDIEVCFLSYPQGIN